MKKILGAIAGLAIVYIGICFSLGFVAESALKEQIDHHNKNASQLNGVKLELKKFSRGIFSSHMDLGVRFQSIDPALQLFSINSHSKIQHGPLLFLNNFAFGAYATQSTLLIAVGDAEADAKIKSIFGDSIGLIRANYSFTKTYSGDWTVDAIDVNENGTQVKVDKSVISFAGDFKDRLAANMKGEINIGAVSVKDATTEMSMDPWTGKVDQTFVDSVPVANMNLTTNKITVKSSMGTPVALENLSIEQKQVVTDKKLNTLVAMRLDKFSGPLEVNNSFYQIEFNNLPLEGMKKVYAVMNNPEHQSSPEMQLAALVPALSNILVDGVQFTLSFGSELMDGKLAGDFNLLYHAAADGKNIMEMESPEQMLALFSADLNLSVSESIANQTPMAAQLQPLVGTYVTLENGVYHLKANLKDTALTVGTQTIPAEQYFPLLMMGAMGMAAGQNPEQPMDETMYMDHTAPEDMGAEMETEEAEVTE